MQLLFLILLMPGGAREMKKFMSMENHFLPILAPERRIITAMHGVVRKNLPIIRSLHNPTEVEIPCRDTL